MEQIEFVIKGPPVGINAKEHSKTSRRKYRQWKESVTQVATNVLPDDWEIIESAEVVVRITNYHSGGFHDVDNVIKPIFDGMNGVVFGDDKQVRIVTSERVDVTIVISNPPNLVLDSLDRYDEFVYVSVEW